MFKTLFKNNWVVTVGGGVLSVLVLRLVDTLFINDFFWEWIKGVFNTIGNFFATEYSVKLYFLILLPILVIAAIIGILYLVSLFKPKPIKEPTFKNPDWNIYKRDIFEGIQYRWDYRLNGSNTKIINIAAFCNKCSCTLVNNSCPNCKTNYSSFIRNTPNLKQPSEVEALIIHRIEKNLFERPIGL